MTLISDVNLYPVSRHCLYVVAIHSLFMLSFSIPLGIFGSAPNFYYDPVNESLARIFMVFTYPKRYFLQPV